MPLLVKSVIKIISKLMSKFIDIKLLIIGCKIVNSVLKYA